MTVNCKGAKSLEDQVVSRVNLKITSLFVTRENETSKK